MRYQIFFDDIDTNIIVDTYTDTIVGKIANDKMAARLCQKLNRANELDKQNTNYH